MLLNASALMKLAEEGIAKAKQSPWGHGPNSALIWLPKIAAAGLPVPRTEIVPFEVNEELYKIFDGKQSTTFDELAIKISKASEIIGYPVFLRTDESSAKHDGVSSYRINGPKDVKHCMYATLEDNEIKGLEPTAFLVREWLELDSLFTAFGGHAIAREWRFFRQCQRGYVLSSLLARTFDSILAWGSGASQLARVFG